MNTTTAWDLKVGHSIAEEDGSTVRVTKVLRMSDFDEVMVRVTECQDLTCRDCGTARVYKSGHRVELAD